MKTDMKKVMNSPVVDAVLRSPMTRLAAFAAGYLVALSTLRSFSGSVYGFTYQTGRLLGNQLEKLFRMNLGVALPLFAVCAAVFFCAEKAFGGKNLGAAHFRCT